VELQLRAQRLVTRTTVLGRRRRSMVLRRGRRLEAAHHADHRRRDRALECAKPVTRPSGRTTGSLLGPPGLAPSVCSEPGSGVKSDPGKARNPSGHLTGPLLKLSRLRRAHAWAPTARASRLTAIPCMPGNPGSLTPSRRTSAPTENRFPWISLQLEPRLLIFHSKKWTPEDLRGIGARIVIDHSPLIGLREAILMAVHAC
jgi:hypothetical protein